MVPEVHHMMEPGTGLLDGIPEGMLGELSRIGHGKKESSGKYSVPSNHGRTPWSSAHKWRHAGLA
jgi:hypothetical protein